LCLLYQTLNRNSWDIETQYNLFTCKDILCFAVYYHFMMIYNFWQRHVYFIFVFGMIWYLNIMFFSNCYATHYLFQYFAIKHFWMSKYQFFAIQHFWMSKGYRRGWTDFWICDFCHILNYPPGFNRTNYRGLFSSIKLIPIVFFI
jgi:hypothetical protein